MTAASTAHGAGGRTLGVLGGTFDPIHFGHLDAATAAREALSLDEVLFVPAHDPPHKPIDPRASAFHRFALVSLAVAECRGCRVSDMELTREGQSYTVDTLRALHADGWQPSQLFFILGADAFAEIATWRAFPEVLDAANFAVVTRPGTAFEQALGSVAGLALAPRREGGTRVIPVEANTRDISSTTIRERLEQRQPIDDLVPRSVARHILTHQLYGAVGRLHGEEDSN